MTAELAFERSGPDCFLSSFTLLIEAVRALGPDAPDRAAVAIGRLCAGADFTNSARDTVGSREGGHL